jgi:hypothetical protein
MSRYDEFGFQKFRELAVGLGMLPEAIDELLRLARLGLWAEKHGIPALENARKRMHGLWLGQPWADAQVGGNEITEALSALPKEKA